MKLPDIKTWWGGLVRRERLMVLSAVAVIAVGIVYTIGIEPALNTRTRLAETLPRLKEDLVRLEGLRQELAELENRSVGKQGRESLALALEQSLSRENLAGEVTNQSEGVILVSTSDVAAAKWFKWVENFAREARIRVVSAYVERSSPGRVDARVTFDSASDK